MRPEIITMDQMVSAVLLWTAFLVVPVVPFLLWVFFANIKKGEKPWLECIGLALCGILYTSFWYLLQSHRTTFGSFLGTVIFVIPPIPFLLWALIARRKKGERPLWELAGLVVCGMLYLSFCSIIRPVRITLAMFLPDLGMIAAAVFLTRAFFDRLEKGEKPWRECLGLGACGCVHTLFWFGMRQLIGG